MPTSLAEVAAQAKDGIATLLASVEGLRPADGVAVVSAALDPLSAQTTILLGDVTISSEGRDLYTRRASFSLAGWVMVFTPEGDEDAIRACRALAADIMARVERAIVADQYVNNTIGRPAGTLAIPQGLQESMSDWNGQAGRQARIPFSVTWTSHVV